jgi:hypothetical protein
MAGSIQALVQEHLGNISDAMSPLQLLNQTLDRASLTNVQSGVDAISGADITRWRSAIEGGTTNEARWLAAEQIRADILKYRVGQEDFEQTFSGTSFGAATQAASTSETLVDGVYTGTQRMGTGGDIASNWVDTGVVHQSNLGTTAQGGRIADDDDDDDDSGSTRLRMQQAFFAGLRSAGLDKETTDKLWTWAEREMQNDPSMSAERLLIAMYDQPEFKDRFPGIAQMPVGARNVPTPGEYIALEKHVSQELKRVGMQKTGETFNLLVTNLFLNNVSGDEVTERLNAAEQVMYNMPQEVRDTFDDWFGPEAGGTIAMETFLDPTDSWAAVKDDISTARTGGWGRMVAGLDAGWNEGLAKQVSDLGLSQAEQWSRFGQLKEQEMLFSETLNETVDLDYAKEGVEAQFGLDTGSSESVNRRAARRSADFSGGGGAMFGGTTTGFGAANA